MKVSNQTAGTVTQDKEVSSHTKMLTVNKLINGHSCTAKRKCQVTTWKGNYLVMYQAMSPRPKKSYIKAVPLETRKCHIK